MEVYRCAQVYKNCLSPAINNGRKTTPGGGCGERMRSAINCQAPRRLLSTKAGDIHVYHVIDRWRTIQYADNVVSSADCTMHVRGKSVDRLSAEHRQEIKQFACKGTLDVSGFAACSTCFNSLWESNRPNCKQLRKVWYVRGGWYTCRPIHWPLIAGLCGGYMLPHVNTPYRIVSHGLS